MNNMTLNPKLEEGSKHYKSRLNLKLGRLKAFVEPLNTSIERLIRAPSHGAFINRAVKKMCLDFMLSFVDIVVKSVGQNCMQWKMFSIIRYKEM